METFDAEDPNSAGSQERGWQGILNRLAVRVESKEYPAQAATSSLWWTALAGPPGARRTAGGVTGGEVSEDEAAVVVREARPDDAGGVVAVLNSAIVSGAPIAFDSPLTEEAERVYIATFPERGIFLVATRGDDETIIGFQSMEPFASYTHAFDHVGVIGTYVDPAYRRLGVATRLFAVTLDAARRKGYEKIITYIRADNDDALAA